MASTSGIPLEHFKRGEIEVDHIEEDLKHINGMHNLQMLIEKDNIVKVLVLKWVKVNV